MKDSVRAGKILHDGSTQEELMRDYHPKSKISFSNEYCEMTLGKAIKLCKILIETKLIYNGDLSYKDKLYLTILHGFTKKRNENNTISNLTQQVETLYLNIYHNSKSNYLKAKNESALPNDFTYYKRLAGKFIGYITTLPKHSWEINALQFKITNILLLADRKHRCTMATREILKLEENSMDIDIVFEKYKITNEHIIDRIKKNAKSILLNLNAQRLVRDEIRSELSKKNDSCKN